MKKSLVTLITLAGCGVLGIGQQPEPPEVFTEAQAAAGRVAYQSSCIACHTETLIPAAGAKYMGQEIPPLAGAAFMERWGARTTSDLSSRIKVAVGGFPPKGRDDKTHLILAAYILQMNGARPGAQELTEATAVEIHSISGGPAH